MAIISCDQAISALIQGQVVAIPTETVYGLAGRIDRDKTLENIFKIKSRPLFDPLIVHVANFKQAQNLASWDPISEMLAQYFWPGPLTLVLEKKETVSSMISASGTTVGIRSPNHPLALEILKEVGPLAAPSANQFGKTSPTSASHVDEEFAGEISVVDGGDTPEGIESTVIQVDPINKVIKILRPGVIDQTHLQDFVHQQKLNFKVKSQQSSLSPGALKNHYQPPTPLTLVDKSVTKEEAFSSCQQEPVSWNLGDDPRLAAREIYGQLREFSKQGRPLYLWVDFALENSPSWIALFDRLVKASQRIIKRDKNGDLALIETT